MTSPAQKPTSNFNIVIPTYNRPKLLERVVKSSLWLGLENYQVVVIDDGSTLKEDLNEGDLCGSKELIERFSDDRLVYSRIETNSGLGAVFERYRENLLTGEYFTVLAVENVAMAYLN